MIGINNKKLLFVTKIGIIILVIYILLFTLLQGIKYVYNINSQKHIIAEIASIKEQIEHVQVEIENSKNQLILVESSYITQEELETRIKGIFERMSVLDFDLKLVSTKKLCIDRYVFMVQVIAYSENGLRAAEGILEYLGKFQVSPDNETIYFVDYFVSKKEQ